MLCYDIFNLTFSLGLHYRVGRGVSRSLARNRLDHHFVVRVGLEVRDVCRVTIVRHLVVQRDHLLLPAALDVAVFTGLEPFDREVANAALALRRLSPDHPQTCRTRDEHLKWPRCCRY